MRKNKIISYALSKLSKTEKELFSLLSGKGTREKVIDFLNGYDIDNEDAVSTFLINHLLDKYSIKDTENSSIARIKGLKEYFHFHNVTALKKLKTGDTLFDADLVLKCCFPDETRPFTSLKPFISEEDFYRLFGRKYTNLIARSAKSVKQQNREYLIPSDRYLYDVLYLNLFIALNDVNYRNSSISYIYDIYRYCDDKGLSTLAVCAIFGNILKKEIGRRARWLIKQKN